MIIRTNEGSLTINASSDTVNHYGYVEVLDVQAIDAIHSYHENGTAGFARLKQGHFVVESEGIINVLYATGLKTEVVVDNNNGIIGKAYATVTETANIYNEVAQEGQSGNVTLEKYDSVITEAVVTAMDSESIVEVLASEGTSNIKTTIKTAVESSSFRGEGTSANPYLISNINELEILRQRVADGNEYTGKHFKLTRNIDMSSISNWLGIGTGGGSSQYCFEGVFDGDGKTISGLRANNSTSEGFGLFSYIRNATIKNFTISDAQIVSTKKIGIAVGMAFGNVDIENITIESNCSITGTSTIGGVVGNIALSNSADDYKKANCYTFTVKNLTNKATVTCSATSQSVTQRVGGVIGNIQKIDDSPATLLDIELKNLTNEGAVSCDYSGGIVGGVQSGFNLSRASYSDDFKYRVMKFVECTNKYAGVKGEIIGYLDGAPKNFEFKKCKVSSDLNNYVNAWNGKLIYCRTENGQYTPSFMFVDNGTIKHTYLIVMNLSSGTTYYNDISNTLTTSRTQFEAYLNNHVQANNEAKTSYGTINQSFENPHGLIHPFETTEGLFSESTPGGNPNDLAYTPYVVIEVEND